MKKIYPKLLILLQYSQLPTINYQLFFEKRLGFQKKHYFCLPVYTKGSWFRSSTG